METLKRWFSIVREYIPGLRTDVPVEELDVLCDYMVGYVMYHGEIIRNDMLDKMVILFRKPYGVMHKLLGILVEAGVLKKVNSKYVISEEVTMEPNQPVMTMYRNFGTHEDCSAAVPVEQPIEGGDGHSDEVANAAGEQPIEGGGHSDEVANAAGEMEIDESVESETADNAAPAV